MREIRLNEGERIGIIFTAHQPKESKIKTVIRSGWRNAVHSSCASRSWLLLYYCRVPQANLTWTARRLHILAPFDSFVRPPTCTARNIQLRKIYEALTNRVNPVISSEGSFLKIITSIHSSVGWPLLASAFCVCLNNLCTQKPPAPTPVRMSINSVRHSSSSSCYLSAPCHLR